MNTIVTVLAALGAAISFACAAVLQQEATQAISDRDALKLRLLVSLLKQPKWVAGVTLLLTGYGLQALALAFGPVALVQPIVVTELAFAIPLATWRRQRQPGGQEWAGIGLVLTGVTAFLLAASPAEGISNPSMLTWALTLIPVGILIAIALTFAVRLIGRARAMLLGATAGTAFALIAVLTKSVTYLFKTDGPEAFLSWQFYAVIGLGIIALVVSQSAYQAGPLAFSMPFIGVLEPVVSVIIGNIVLNEQIGLNPTLVGLEAGAGAAATMGIILLATSPVVLSIYQDSRLHGPTSMDEDGPGD